MSDGRDSFADYRDILAGMGFQPSRRLGQNFLLDPSLHRVLVDAVAPGGDDVVLEVGPGLGFLTRELAGRARDLKLEVSLLHGQYLVIADGNPRRGWGVYVLDAATDRDMAIQVPAPLDEPQAADAAIGRIFPCTPFQGTTRRPAVSKFRSSRCGGYSLSPRQEA